MPLIPTGSHSSGDYSSKIDLKDRLALLLLNAHLDFVDSKAIFVQVPLELFIRGIYMCGGFAVNPVLVLSCLLCVSQGDISAHACPRSHPSSVCSFLWVFPTGPAAGPLIYTAQCSSVWDAGLFINLL